MRKTAFVDDQATARDFHTGDVVRKAGLRGFFLSPYVGRVVYSNVSTGTVQVEWPWGAEQESASDLVKDLSGHLAPTSATGSYSTLELADNLDGKEVEKANAKWRKSVAARVVEAYERRTLPLWRAACEAWHCQMPEMEAYIRMASVFGGEYGDDAVRLTVANLYEHGRRLAIYWANDKRQYRVTKKERTTGKLICSRCKSLLRPRVFTQGQRLLACKICGFAIHPKDLLQ